MEACQENIRANIYWWCYLCAFPQMFLQIDTPLTQIFTITKSASIIQQVLFEMIITDFFLL